jgi:RecA-family ATPase
MTGADEYDFARQIREAQERVGMRVPYRSDDPDDELDEVMAEREVALASTSEKVSTNNGLLRCGFCNKSQNQVKKLISGAGGSYICDKCIAAANDVLATAGGDSFATDVERETHRLRVRDAAQRKIRKENDRDYGNLNPTPLADFLAVEDDPVAYRINSLWPRGARIVLAAQAKAGKTTLVGNVMRSILDGDPFLGKYQTEPIQGGAILLDFEMDDRTIRKWLRDQQISNTATSAVEALRGKASTFDILDPQIRSEWAKRLSGYDAVIADCLRPILDALGLDMNRDAGRFLTAFDELLNEAGVTEALMLHHMGHTGERSAGDSRIISWPDATWKMFRENPEVEDSPRYLSAYGRDVYSPEDELHYNPQHRRLTLTGDGSRKQAKEMKLQAAVMKVVKATHPINGTQVEAALREDGVTFQKGEERKALAALVRKGLLKSEPGPKNSKLYSPTIQSPQPPQASPRGDGEGE